MENIALQCRPAFDCRPDAPTTASRKATNADARLSSSPYINARLQHRVATPRNSFRAASRFATK